MLERTPSSITSQQTCPLWQRVLGATCTNVDLWSRFAHPSVLPQRATCDFSQLVIHQWHDQCGEYFTTLATLVPCIPHCKELVSCQVKAALCPQLCLHLHVCRHWFITLPSPRELYVYAILKPHCVSVCQASNGRINPMIYLSSWLRFHPHQHPTIICDIRVFSLCVSTCKHIPFTITWISSCPSYDKPG